MTYRELSERLLRQVQFLSGDKLHLQVASIDVRRLMENLEELHDGLMDAEITQEGLCDWCDREAIGSLKDGSPVCYEHMRMCEVG